MGPKKPQDSNGLSSGAHILGPVAKETTLRKGTCTPTFTAALVPRAKPQKQPTGNRRRPGQHDVVQTHEGKAQAIQKGGKNATSSNKEGPSEDPRKPSQSARERPVSHGVTSRRKLKIQSHQLIEKRDTNSH